MEQFKKDLIKGKKKERRMILLIAFLCILALVLLYFAIKLQLKS